jgi:hypothetical protein
LLRFAIDEIAPALHKRAMLRQTGLKSVMAGLAVATCFTVLAGCESPFGFLQNFTPAQLVHPSPEQLAATWWLMPHLQAASVIKAGMSIDDVALLLRESDFIVEYRADEGGKPFLQALASQSPDPVQGPAVLVRVYYEAGKVTHRDVGVTNVEATALGCCPEQNPSPATGDGKSR